MISIWGPRCQGHCPFIMALRNNSTLRCCSSTNRMVRMLPEGIGRRLTITIGRRYIWSLIRIGRQRTGAVWIRVERYRERWYSVGERPVVVVWRRMSRINTLWLWIWTTVWIQWWRQILRIWLLLHEPIWLSLSLRRRWNLIVAICHGRSIPVLLYPHMCRPLRGSRRDWFVHQRLRLHCLGTIRWKQRSL